MNLCIGFEVHSLLVLELYYRECQIEGSRDLSYAPFCKIVSRFCGSCPDELVYQI